jgi:hypothetical protein
MPGRGSSRDSRIKRRRCSSSVSPGSHGCRMSIDHFDRVTIYSGLIPTITIGAPHAVFLGQTPKTSTSGLMADGRGLVHTSPTYPRFQNLAYTPPRRCSWRDRMATGTIVGSSGRRRFGLSGRDRRGFVRRSPPVGVMCACCRGTRLNVLKVLRKEFPRTEERISRASEPPCGALEKRHH